MLLAAEDQLRSMELDSKTRNERLRRDEEQIKMLEKRNRDLEEAKRKLGRDLVDVNRNTENEAARLAQLKGIISFFSFILRSFSKL